MSHPTSRHNSSSLSCMIPRIAARVLAATLTGAAFFVSAPVHADYNACMTFCLDEHSFSYCHPICVGSASSAGTTGDTGSTGGTESAVPLFTAEKCRTFEEKDWALSNWFAETYGIGSGGQDTIDDELDVWKLLWSRYGTDDVCTGIVTFNDACQVFETEKIECSPVYED